MLLLFSITWEDSGAAAGYRVWIRNINEANSEFVLVANVSDACNDEYFLFPGVWNYAFALSAFNGNKDSARGPSAVAPSPAASATAGNEGPKCPGPQIWCPNGAPVDVPPGSSDLTTSNTATPTSGGGAPTSLTTGIPVTGYGSCLGPDCEDGRCTGKHSSSATDIRSKLTANAQDSSVSPLGALGAAVIIPYA